MSAMRPQLVVDFALIAVSFPSRSRSFLEQDAAVLGPAHARDAGRFALEPLELELLAQDHVALRAHLVGELAVLDQEPPMRENLENRRLEVGVGPRLAHEPEDARMVDGADDAVDVGTG